MPMEYLHDIKQAQRLFHDPSPPTRAIIVSVWKDHCRSATTRQEQEEESRRNQAHISTPTSFRCRNKIMENRVFPLFHS
jgi:hypothetical protein